MTCSATLSITGRLDHECLSALKTRLVELATIGVRFITIDMREAQGAPPELSWVLVEAQHILTLQRGMITVRGLRLAMAW
jgi:hypothetical protein